MLFICWGSLLFFYVLLFLSVSFHDAVAVGLWAGGHEVGKATLGNPPRKKICLAVLAQRWTIFCSYVSSVWLFRPTSSAYLNQMDLEGICYSAAHPHSWPILVNKWYSVCTSGRAPYLQKVAQPELKHSLGFSLPLPVAFGHSYMIFKPIYCSGLHI